MSKTYRVSSNVIGRPVGDEMIVLDLAEGGYHRLNPAAAQLWERLERGASVDELVAAIVDVFEVDAARAREDVEAVIRDAVELGLVSAN